MTQTLREKIAEKLLYIHLDGATDYDAEADAILSVIAESVPDLKWEAEDGRETCLDAEGCDKLYRVLVRHEGTAVLRHNASSFQQEEYMSEESAKAAAQADYTRRILSGFGLVDHTNRDE